MEPHLGKTSDLEQLPDLPEGCKDAIHTDVRVMFGFWDRVRLLFGAQALVRVANYTEVRQGKVMTDSRVNVFWPWRWPWQKQVTYVEARARMGRPNARR